MMLKQANDYVHKIITTSASLPGTLAEDIAFNDMAIENMREDISAGLLKLNPEYKNQTLSQTISNPILLEVYARYTKTHNLGNCGEFAILALTYLLQHHKDALKNIAIEVREAGTENNLDHIYFHIKEDGKPTLLWDPSLREVSECKLDTDGHVYYRGKKGQPNQYQKFDPEVHVTAVITTITPTTFPYPLSIEQLVEVDKFIKDPDNKPQARSKSTCSLM